MKSLLLVLLFLPLAFGDIAPDNAILEATYQSSGLYNLVGLGTWNGQPLSPTNFPSDQNRLLEATINLYVSNSLPNDLFVQVTNVTTTVGAFWFGTAFDDVTQSGIELLFPSSLGAATLNSNYANPGEILANGLSGTEVDSPLSNTPGYSLTVTADSYLIATISGAEYGFTSLGDIHGAQRIRGGGLFDLQFAPSVDVATSLSGIAVDSLYGDQGTNQAIPAVLTTAITPEPNELGVVAILAVLLLFLRWPAGKRLQKNN
jgi:hypothetical protein